MNLAHVVSSQLIRFGQPCAVSWRAIGTGSSAAPAASLPGVIRIGRRVTTVVAGAMTQAVEAQMAPVGRSLQGAKISLGGVTYTVQSADERSYQGVTYMVRVVLTT